MEGIEKSAGSRLQEALRQERPLQVVGTVNALTALMAKQAGFRAIYLSGSGVASASYGLPDLGLTTLDNVVEDASRITSVVDLAMLVDIDTGFGETAVSIGRTIKRLETAGVAAIHIEDQVVKKRCGHLPGKELVSVGEMCDRIKAAVDAHSDPDFMIMARTDAFAEEGLQGALDRAGSYVEAGAGAIFAEALNKLQDYKNFTEILPVPVLANLTEFGQTPLFTLEQMKSVGVSLVLYPLTAFRAMNQVAETAYQVIRKKGTQKSIINELQTRKDLYDLLNYYEYEEMMDLPRINKLKEGERHE